MKNVYFRMRVMVNVRRISIRISSSWRTRTVDTELISIQSCRQLRLPNIYCLRSSMVLAIRKNQRVVFRNSRFCDIIQDSTSMDNSPNAILKKEFAHSKLAKSIWNRLHLHYIILSFFNKLRFLQDIFSCLEKFH